MTKKWMLTFVDGGGAMSFRALMPAVHDAFQKRDYKHCLDLLDGFLNTATGEERIEALLAKSNIIYCVHPAQAVEGLALVNEARELARTPSTTLWCLSDALSLCHVMGDVDRARQYEVAAHRLLQEHGSDPVVSVHRFGLYINMGLIAMLRGEYPTAYWQFIQAQASLQQHPVQDLTIQRKSLLIVNLHIATVCLYMSRIPEAWEAMEKAEGMIASENEKVQWSVLRAKILRQTGRLQEATAALDCLSTDREALWNPTNRVNYRLVQALISHDSGNLKAFHHHLSMAQTIAVDHSLEFLLCEVQRVQRTPITLEVAR
jgi:hypothetical protein